MKLRIHQISKTNTDACISADKIGEADKRNSGVILDRDLMSIVYDRG